MSDQQVGYLKHLFVCTNSPERPGKCGSKGAEKLRKDLKDQCFNEFGKGSVRVNASGCLGYCEQGIAAVLYKTTPDNLSGHQAEWFLGLAETDSEVLMRALKKS